MYVSGRMHKPVRIVVCSSSSILAASRENLRHALRTALLLLPASFTAEQLFVTIAALSYTGDFRMVFGEHPDKVRNIVTKSMPLFYALYMPVIKANFPTVTPAPLPLAADASDAPISSSGSSSGGGNNSGYVSADGAGEHPVAFRQDTSPEARLALCMALPYHLQKRMAASFFAALGRRNMNQSVAGAAPAVDASLAAGAVTGNGSHVGIAGGGAAVSEEAAAGSSRIAAARQRWAQAAFLRRRIGSTTGTSNGSASSLVNSSVSWRSPAAVLRSSQRRAAGAAAVGPSRLSQQLLRARALAMASSGREMMQRARVQRLQWIVSRQLKREARAAPAPTPAPAPAPAPTAAASGVVTEASPPLSLTASLRQQALRILEQRRAKLAARLSGSKQLNPPAVSAAGSSADAHTADAAGSGAAPRPLPNLAGELATDAEGQRAEELRNLLEADGEAAQLSFARAARDAQIVSFWEAMLGDSLRDRHGLAHRDGGSRSSAGAAAARLAAAPSASAAAAAAAAALGGPATVGEANSSAAAAAVPVAGVDIASRVRMHLRPALAHIVGASARSQSLKGVITAGPVKAAVYAAAKVRKYLGALASKR